MSNTIQQSKTAVTHSLFSQIMAETKSKSLKTTTLLSLVSQL